MSDRGGRKSERGFIGSWSRRLVERAMTSGLREWQES